jgi:hypothetical protein
MYKTYLLKIIISERSADTALLSVSVLSITLALAWIYRTRAKPPHNQPSHLNNTLTLLWYIGRTYLV